MEENHDIKSNLDIATPFTDRLAIYITDMMGTIRFLILCLFVFILWVAWNSGLAPRREEFDSFPFPGLTIFASIFAIALSIMILISQNRQSRQEKIRRQVEFEVNLYAEKEITKILSMLHEIQIRLDIGSKPDIELEKMKEDLDVQKIHEIIDMQEKNAESVE